MVLLAQARPSWHAHSLRAAERMARGFVSVRIDSVYAACMLTHHSSFYMRKGADCLSKWVGEAERQRPRDEAADLALWAATGLLPERPRIDGSPLAPPPLAALTLNLVQACNMSCGYCYADEGRFGSRPRSMPAEVARAAVDRLIAEAAPGADLVLGFMGGEPLLHRQALRTVTGYAARERTCRRSQRASGTAADGVSKEPAQYRTANGPDGIAIVAALDLYGARMHDGTVSHALHLFGFRCGINVAGQAAAAHAACERKTNHRYSQNT